jgi:TRAP-type C4-dicarboxylate transport system substrate-binding protein
MNRLMRSCCMGVAAVFVAALVAFPAEARTLKINEDFGPGSTEEMALKRFKEIVEKKTNGELEIAIFLQTSLGDLQTSFENMMNGTLDLYSGALSYYATLVPEELGVSALLYLFKDNDHLARYLQSPTFEKAHDKLKAMGIRFISTDFAGYRGPYRIFASTKPILKLEDFQGLKMRMWANDIAVRAWKHIGASPVIIPWQEAYISIRQGLAGAVTGGVAAIHDMNFAEVAPYLTELRQFPQTWPIAASEKVFQSLSPEHQKILVDAANEATAYYGKLSQESGEKNIRNMIQKDNAVYIRINTDPIVKKMASFYEQLISEGVLKREVYEAVMKLR